MVYVIVADPHEILGLYGFQDEETARLFVAEFDDTDVGAEIFPLSEGEPALEAIRAGV